VVPSCTTAGGTSAWKWNITIILPAARRIISSRIKIVEILTLNYENVFLVSINTHTYTHKHIYIHIYIYIYIYICYDQSTNSLIERFKRPERVLAVLKRPQRVLVVW
jgi:hypothetical protein